MRIGDKVMLPGRMPGVVVCVIDTGEFSDEYPEGKWGYLKVKMMIEGPDFGLAHAEEYQVTLINEPIPT